MRDAVARGGGSGWIVTAAACLFLWCSPAPVLAEATSGIAWEKSFSSALKQARKSGRPVMAAFWAEWCPWCRKLDTVTYPDPGVVALSRQFVPVKVNVEGGLEEREITFEYGFVELPTIAFFSPQGRLLMTLKRYQGPDEFPETLRAALASAERIGTWEQALRDKDATRRAEALAALGAHLYAQGRLDESRKLLEQALKRDARRPVPERKASRTLLGRIRLEQDAPKHAARLAREALALQPAITPQDARALVLLGYAERAAGRSDAARASLEQALRLDPDGPAADEARRALGGDSDSR